MKNTQNEHTVRAVVRPKGATGSSSANARQEKAQFACSCPGFKNRVDCKHVDAVAGLKGKRRSKASPGNPKRSDHRQSTGATPMVDRRNIGDLRK